jgi:uncharacterized protein (TIGR00369 family)
MMLRLLLQSPLHLPLHLTGSIAGSKKMTDNRTRTYSWHDPMISAAAAHSLSGLAFMQAIIRGEILVSPIAMTFDYRLVEVDEGRAVFEGEPAEFHYNPIGVVHGGFAMTLLDSALGCSVHTTLPQGVAYTTLQVNVNLVRAITRDTGRVRCEARAIHSGRQMATAEATLYDLHGKTYAHGTTTCLVFPRRQPD